jgi:glycosyltransferase involved in cell wall biosynthesis
MHVHEQEIGIALAVRQYRDAVLKIPDRYITVSDAVTRALTRGQHVPREKITMVHEAVPDAYAAANSAMDRNPAAAVRPLIVGGCGSPYWRKGVFLWLQVAQQVVRAMGAGAVRFQWVGVAGDDEMILCRESAEKLGVATHVEFISSTPEPLTWFRQFDLFAMTSIEDPCPIVVLENMMLGTPVLCFREGGGAPEEIGDIEAAIPDFSVTAMAERIVVLAADRLALKALGEQAAERVRSHFVVSVQAPKILAVMQAVASMGRAG